MNHVCLHCGHTEAQCEKTQKLLYKEAIRIVVDSGKASASVLQRRPGIGYARAARFIDTMEEQGIVGPAQANSQPRDVYFKSTQSAEQDPLGSMLKGNPEEYKEALKVVRETGKASASLLQRKMGIGYAKAARFIDTMEEQGIIGPATGNSEPRDVLPES